MTSHSGLIFEPWEKYVGNWHEKQTGALSKWSQREGKIKLEWLKQEGNNDGSGTNPAGERASTVSLGRNYNGTHAKRQATCKQKSSRSDYGHSSPAPQTLDRGAQCVTNSQGGMSWGDFWVQESPELQRRSLQRCMNTRRYSQVTRMTEKYVYQHL